MEIVSDLEKIMEIRQLSSHQAWHEFKNTPTAYLIDVRTPQEWRITGIAPIAESRQLLLSLIWADNTFNPDFIETFQKHCLNKTQPLYFVCKKGIRSQKAAELMAFKGYTSLVNIYDGFESLIHQIQSFPL
ncbi:rhodanese-like domain-containing protein [Entomobacter blattae]|uniref:Rhodanese domain-containing protein n=1 Tax=Entomobacter blattae TaxID=2762277 RepID=A0A7H1NQ06_9PROT|nr:rhodanese-like domain-containing protein [Entomobacter blattae]QNT77866.1 hypothetical protein JGUZn3_06240 [Entomobacter blattae]